MYSRERIYPARRYQFEQGGKAFGGHWADDSRKSGATAGSQTATFGTGTSNDNVILGLLAVKGASPAQTAPTITSGNATTFTVGTAGTFTVTSTGSPTPTLSETGALPNNVTFVDNGNGTATLGGTPAAGTAGSYPITIKAHNGVGADASQSFTLTVKRRKAVRPTLRMLPVA